MQKFTRTLAFLALLTSLLTSACTPDADDPASTSRTEATSTPIEAGATSTPLATETAQATPTPTAVRQPNFVGNLGDYLFVVLVEQETAELIEGAPPWAVLTFEEVASPAEAMARVESTNAAGLILDEATYADFPIGHLAVLYDDGRVLVVFDVPLDDVHLSVPQGERVDADLGINPPSPYYSIVHGTRPDVRPRTGAARTSAFLQDLFHEQVPYQADIAFGRIRP